jgi:hypothetical protein
MELMSEIRYHTALNIHVLDGDTPLTHLTGDTADISVSLGGMIQYGILILLIHFKAKG